MTNHLYLVLLGLIIWASSESQNIYAFYEYDIKDGQLEAFMDGYAKDLAWHESQGDDWSWPGWFVMTGERRMRFIDATPDHKWADFDDWKVDGTENFRNNLANWVPYVDGYGGSYREVYEEGSEYAKDWYTSPFLQVYHLQIKCDKAWEFERFMRNYSKRLKSMVGMHSYVWMKTISGGIAAQDVQSGCEHVLFVALPDMATMRVLKNIFAFPSGQHNLSLEYADAVMSLRSELWRFTPRLSLIQSDKTESED